MLLDDVKHRAVTAILEDNPVQSEAIGIEAVVSEQAIRRMMRQARRTDVSKWDRPWRGDRE